MRFITFLIIAGLMLALVGAYSPAQAVGSTFVVNSTANGSGANDGILEDGVCDTGHIHTLDDNNHVDTFTGVCTLAAATQQANFLPDKDTIAFNIPGPGPHTISGIWGDLVTLY